MITSQLKQFDDVWPASTMRPTAPKYVAPMPSEVADWVCDYLGLEVQDAQQVRRAVETRFGEPFERPAA